MNAPLLRAEGVVVRYPSAGGGEPVAAVEGVDLQVGRAELLALVGESGSGKSSLGRALLRLEPLTAGRIYWEGREVTDVPPGKLRALRRRVQIIFQDPAGALDPRQTVGASLEEPLEIHGLCCGAERALRAANLLEKVGLSASLAHRYPHELSGGQRQRVGIARALAVEPALIVADEPVSSLDVSVQAQIVNLLADLKEELGLSFLFITHDLGLVSHLADRVAVMYRGRIVELAPAAAFFAGPLHPYSQALLAASRGAGHLGGEPPDPRARTPGCAFAPRCARAVEACGGKAPEMLTLPGDRSAACLRLESDPQSR